MPNIQIKKPANEKSLPVFFCPPSKISSKACKKKTISKIEQNNGDSESNLVIDLFCGVGGFSLGAARAGFRVLGAVDNYPNALNAHKKNFRGSIHLDLDVSRIDGKYLLGELSIEAGKLAGLVGGPPCQGFSFIGKNCESDPRNLLFVHFFKIASEIKPLFFLCENVPGILRENYASIRKKAIDCVQSDYLVLPPLILKASDYGAPTTRERAFFFGYRRDSGMVVGLHNFLPPSNIDPINVRQALKGLPRKIDPNWQSEKDSWRRTYKSHNGSFGERVNGFIPDGVGDPAAIDKLIREKKVSGCLGTLHTAELVERIRTLGSGMTDKISKSRRLDPKGYCPTLRAGTGSDHGSFQAVRPIHPYQDRVITPREAARLQGFPDWFQFDSTKWHSFRLIGNSVSPILAEHLLSVIYQALQASTKEC